MDYLFLKINFKYIYIIIQKFDISYVRDTIDIIGIQNFEKQYGNIKYLITNTDLYIDNFIKLQSIDDIELSLIKNY